MKNCFLFGGLLYIAVLGSSCTAYKAARQVKKGDKIFAAAISNEDVSQRLDAYYNVLHPLQKIVLVKGKDSIIEVPVIIDRVHDSIIHAACPTLNFDSLKKAVATTKLIMRVDTLKVPDSTCERRAQIVQNNYSNLQGRFEQQSEQLSVEKKRGNKWLWFFIGACVFIVAENGLIIYKKVK